jgi:beta-xylosidase
MKPALLTLAVVIVAPVAGVMRAGQPVVWHLDNLQRIGGHAVTLVGQPRVVSDASGSSIEFNGSTDGLVLDANPIEGLEQFTIEITFQPAADGTLEQRFLHIEEPETANRALIELRMLPGARWSLDTYLRSGESALTLLDWRNTHPASAWHVATLVYDGRTMAHYVNGIRESSGEVSLKPLLAGRTSIGVRQNRVSWFKGRIKSIRFSPGVTPSTGFEGQRRGDLGNGFYLNPIVAGDHPDPTVLKDGDDYYMTFSSFDAYPGLVIWHSRDLINWRPIGPALHRNVGSVWAPDLVKHNNRYYIYFPGIALQRSNYVVWADDIRGPWSDPIDLKIGRIDPGHAVGPDGRRYLFLSAGYMVPLAADGLSVTGEMKKVYDGWQYPADWVVEGFAQEGPKILKRGAYYYMVLAQGGTAGPPTGHMIVAARARSIEGPWENSPDNPIVRTKSASEQWWSKGHGTLVEGPSGSWYLVYHAYENGFYNLGRQTLLEPIEWTGDGWFRITSQDAAQPIVKPDRRVDASPHGFPFSDDFSSNRMGVQWGFYAGGVADRDRYRYENGALILKAKGSSPADSSPLSFVTGDHAYEVEVDIDADQSATAGLLLFYNRRLYVGLGYSASNLIMHSYGIERPQAKPPKVGQRLHLRLRNDRHIVTDSLQRRRREMGALRPREEVSGYHHNVGYDFLSLRPALYAAGSGEVRFRNFRYRALP